MRGTKKPAHLPRQHLRHAMPGGDRAAVHLLAELLTPAPTKAGGPPTQAGARELVS
jgi:hypothetical protein